MTITTTQIKSVAVSDGANATWPFDFLIPNLESLVLTVIDTASGNPTVIAPVNFTVVGLNDPNGGSVTYPTSGPALAAGFTVVVERVVAELQQTDLLNQGGAYPADIEAALDYQMMVSQQLQDQVNRSIVFSVADEVEVTLPLAAARAGLLLAFDSAGDPVAVAGIDPSVTVSAAMIPVVTAPTTNDALTALGLPGVLLDLLIPAGTLWPYTLTTAPTGFVLPYGQPCTAIYPVYRAALIAASNPYGNNGTDPLMPDLRSAVPGGKSNMGGVDNGLLTGGTVLGALLGTQTRTLLTSNLPAYTPTGTLSLAATAPLQGFAQTGAQVLTAFSLGSNNGGATTLSITFTPGLNTFTGTAQGGTSAAFSIVQPTFICNYILKVH